ncbi:hypothetical protein THIOSC13_580001 [uncultured Thiomicrorhabdus sp.]
MTFSVSNRVLPFNLPTQTAFMRLLGKLPGGWGACAPSICNTH